MVTVAQAGETVKRVGWLALTFAPVPTILSVSSSLGIGDGRAKGGCMRRDEYPIGARMRKAALFGILLAGWPVVGGCVVLEEKFNAEKARSLNFQRLLAQEEKRTAELDSEVKRTKTELAEFEARNRELSAQVQMAREQMTRLQEETEAIREATVLERKALEDMQRKGPSAAGKPKKIEPFKEPAKVTTTESSASDAKASSSQSTLNAMPKSGSTVHVVKPGETLFGISRRYGLDIEKVKKMNKLPDDIIEVGQKILVGSE
uniref:LysM peptidoglycan-binding domain-containing protein n=1 Tax=Nitrospira cf. moscoviensis SBR1015 TaxID=96242 RepID=UPI000A381624|nr:LysM peptidoglycan-binding domain-containing protein [Nitrospira cf. moscoviensis SBR1015]